MKKLLLISLIALMSACSTIGIQNKAEPPSAKVFNERAMQAIQSGDFKAAYAYARDAIGTVPNNPYYLSNGSRVAIEMGYYDQALEWGQQALTIFKGADHPDIARAYGNLGSVWKAKGQYDKAIEYYELALKSDLNTYDADHRYVARAHNGLGMAWYAKGDYDKAIEYYELALKSDLNTYGADHPAVATRHNNLGSAWYDKGDYDKAIEYFELALESFLNTLGAEHPYVTRAHYNLGRAWQDKGDYDKAIEYYELALTVASKTLGLAHPNTKLFERHFEKAIAKRDQQNK